MNSEISLTIRSYHLNIPNKRQGAELKKILFFVVQHFELQKVNFNSILSKKHAAKTHTLNSNRSKF